MTRTARVSFVSDAPLEKIEGQNAQGTSVLDRATGKMEFAVLMKAFEFEKALMQEHFNENYAESDKFPKAVFKGSILNLNTVDFRKDGVYPVKYKGSMTLHGVTRELAGEGQIEIKGGRPNAKSVFLIALADYNISIPSLVKDKVSKEVRINVDAAYEKM